METNTASNSPADWSHYIKQNFFSAWADSTPVDITPFAFLFEHHFDLNKISIHLAREISEADEPERSERYHQNRIRTLTHIFIESLLEISDDGKHITSKNIAKAKEVMESETRCIYDC